MNSAPPAPGTGRYHIRLVTSEEEFRSLEPVWDDMLGQLDNTNVFVSFEWMWTWWSCLKKGKQLLLIVVKHGDETVAIAPLMRDKRRIPFTPITFKELRFLSTVPAAYSPSSFAGTLDVLTRPGHESAREALARYVLTQIGDFNCLRLHPLPDDSATSNVFQRVAQDLDLTATVGKVFDNACLRVAADWETYYKQRKKKERWRLKRLTEKFGQNHDVDWVELAGPDQLDEAVGNILEVEGQSWKIREGVSIDDPEYNHFYFELAKVLSRKGWLRVFVLKANGRPVAYQYYVQYRGCVTALKTSYDKSFEQFAPGKLLIPLAFERFFRDGVNEVDLLWGNLNFKRKWTDHLCSRHEICVYGKDPYSRFIRAALTSPTLRRMWRYWRRHWERLRQRTD
ncbi:MAG: hypothetical protein AMS20_16675 [Gemmatimonas sp. SG8_28]|nr:MAG: hypothetical protein AMS20_16675 [Gemmatimonas sp. SG8_28]